MKTHATKAFGRWDRVGAAVFRVATVRIVVIRWLGLVVAGLSAVWAGYGLGLERGGGERGLAPGEAVGLEVYARADSFSEVAEARTRLRALCLRAISEFQIRTLVQRGVIVSKGDGRDVVPAKWSEEDDIASVVEEFRDTIEESLVLKQYLRVLSESGKDSVWLDRYLDFARRHPRSDLVSDLEPVARERAARLGRGAEIAPLDALLAVVRTLESDVDAAKREGG